jgi:hypothetical protein
MQKLKPRKFKPLSRKEILANQSCTKKFCTDYYVAKMKKNIKMYNPALMTKRHRNKNLAILCSSSFCGTRAYNKENYNKNFHKSIPLSKVQKLKKLGAISGLLENKYIH